MSETHDDDIAVVMDELGAQARSAARALYTATAERKHAALIAAAEALWEHRDHILQANSQDGEMARQKGLSAAMLDRLALDVPRIRAMQDSLRAVAEQKDPVGETLAQWERPNGLNIRRVRTPIGVIGVIYEARPNVTADAGALCLKSGNAVILRGGSECFRSAQAIYSCLRAGLRAADLPEAAIQLVPTTSREAVTLMLGMREHIDVIVPRGGKSLVELVQREARVPVFAHLAGIVHIYIDKAADPEKAARVVLNAKTRRSGICGAVECVLLHEEIAQTIGRDVLGALMAAGVRVNACPVLQQIEGTTPATSADWGREYLDLEIAARAVASQEEAMAHIRQFGSGHTDCIITEDQNAATQFLTQLDSAILMHNASTQFSDGGEFGMGAEIGIATGKLHARGPVGAEQLTSFKYLVQGDGAVRS